ncbi:MAG: peptidoglycan DD-metalloendopeptidase family protein [Micrococcales bacterium]|nr:peptidoglycan DD-metalloendopeptidase family protein [Micrococcales bacterium]
MTRSALRQERQADRPQPVAKWTKLVRDNTWALAAAAAAIMVVGSGFVAGETTQATGSDSIDALVPLRQTAELVSRRNVAQVSSRSMTARLESEPVEASINETQASNAALVLALDLPELAAEESITIRRSAGDQPPATPVEGVEVELAEGTNQVVDEGLSPDTTYSYTAFLHRPDAKPEVVGRLVATTSLYPTELQPGTSLITGERLVSPDNAYFFTVTDEGLAVLFNNRNQKIWSLGADPVSQAEVVMGVDGELAVNGPEGAVWQSNTDAAGARLTLSDAGELQLVQNGAVVWSSAEHGESLHGGDSPYTVSASGWTQPAAGKLSSRFGGRNHPIFGGYRQHEGVDLLGGGRGDPIYAAHDGVVEEVRCDSGGNWTLIIDHGDGITTRYLHWDGMNNVLVAKGDTVVAGQHVANIGNSGNSTGPHLHFEVRVNGTAVEPLGFLTDHGVNLAL